MSAPPAILKRGVWGGEQVLLTVGETKAVLRLGCAEGELPAPIKLDSSGRFSLPGLFSTQTGGPSTSADRAVRARFDGVVHDNRLTLTVERGAATETYQLTHGLQSKVIRCL
jgi:hypothetical protein